MNHINFITYLIIIFGCINLVRMAIFLIGSDIYTLRQHILRKRGKKKNFPKFSVVIPAHNEEKIIKRCVLSVVKNDYPKDKLQVIVVDDGSEDKTKKAVRSLILKNKIKNVKLVIQKNSGKANALNNGIKNYASGKLVMCLDSDSYLDKNALKNAAKYFEDKKVMALSSNVKIHKRKGLFNLIQQYEYLICSKMKGAQTVFNIEYIIGGVGSTFRRSILKKVKYYDGDTVTEDIDLTMKILQGGNKENRVIYGSDVITYTEAVLDMRGLITQRYRWKWGRSQTFLKNKNLFFNKGKKFTKGLTHFYLPFAIFGDIAYFLEPIFVMYIIFLLLYYGDAITLLSAFTVISIYLSSNLIMEDTLEKKEKLFYLFITPLMYFYFYILSFAEYIALIKAIFNIKNLRKSIEENTCNWQHVRRPGTKVATKSYVA